MYEVLHESVYVFQSILAIGKWESMNFILNSPP